MRTRKTARQIRNEKGQATIEFALTLILLMAFVLFYVQLSLVLAWGNYVQYATFMAARAYQAASATREDQRARAISVITRMLKKRGSSSMDRIPFVAKGEGDGDVKGLMVDPPEQFNPSVRNLSWLEGVRYTFKSRIFVMPLAGKPEGQGVNTVPFTSESWLGREPSYAECEAEMKAKGWAFDNGC